MNKLISIENQLTETKNAWNNLDKRNIVQVIRLGKELNAVRQRLGGVAFKQWLQSSNFPLSFVMAYHFINVARRFPDPDNAKMLKMPLTVFYKLAAPGVDKSLFIRIMNKAREGHKITMKDLQ